MRYRKKQSNSLLNYEMQSFVYLLINECAHVDVCASVCVYVTCFCEIQTYAHFGFIYSFTLHIAGYLWCGIEIFCVCVYSNANVG